jgi:hypothetical protein
MNQIIGRFRLETAVVAVFHQFEFFLSLTQKSITIGAEFHI